MKKIEGYDNAQTTTKKGRLPIGGYVLKILDVKYKKYSWSEVIVLSFDVAEGDQKDFFKEQYESQTYEDKKWKGTYRLYIPKNDGSKKDNWTMRNFKSTMQAFELSNKGYHWNWDEDTLKDKLIGGIFNNKEYDIDGNTGFYTNCHSLVPVEDIRSGNYKIPADTRLKKHASQMSDFMNVPEGSNEVPFN